MDVMVFSGLSAGGEIFRWIFFAIFGKKWQSDVAVAAELEAI
jgi:hypothetical protein